MTAADDTIVHGLWALSSTGAAPALLCSRFTWDELILTFGNPAVVRQTRSDLRLSQAELAKEAGISKQLLAFIETGERRMTPEVMQSIWRALWNLSQRTPPAVELLIKLNEAMDAAIVTEKVPL
jgi:predicted transcriptional regulator